MPKVKVDGQELEVPQGATVLQEHRIGISRRGCRRLRQTRIILGDDAAIIRR